ncbi:MAG: hypothetical protein ABIJ08_04610 [Nanoarchaeota archaeon]
MDNNLENKLGVELISEVVMPRQHSWGGALFGAAAIGGFFGVVAGLPEPSVDYFEPQQFNYAAALIFGGMMSLAPILGTAWSNSSNRATERGRNWVNSEKYAALSERLEPLFDNPGEFRKGLMDEGLVKQQYVDAIMIDYFRSAISSNDMPGIIQAVADFDNLTSRRAKLAFRKYVDSDPDLSERINHLDTVGFGNSFAIKNMLSNGDVLLEKRWNEDSRGQARLETEYSRLKDDGDLDALARFLVREKADVLPESSDYYWFTSCKMSEIIDIFGDEGKFNHAKYLLDNVMGYSIANLSSKIVTCYSQLADKALEKLNTPEAEKFIDTFSDKTTNYKGHGVMVERLDYVRTHYTFKIAEKYLQENDLGEAERVAEKVKNYGGYNTLMFEVANAYFQQGDMDNAGRLYSDLKSKKGMQNVIAAFKDIGQIDKADSLTTEIEKIKWYHKLSSSTWGMNKLVPDYEVSKAA